MKNANSNQTITANATMHEQNKLMTVLKRFNLKMTAMLMLAAVLFMTQGCKEDEAAADPLSSPEYVALNGAMRKLWSDHMQWTYATVDAYFNNPDGLQAQLDRLLQNQTDIGNAIKPYYGDAAGDTLTSLLNQHINLAVPVLEAAKNGDNTALSAASANWYANAKEIADFLSAANPSNWPQHDMEHSMEHHIETTTTYAVDLLGKDYTNAVIHFDEAHNHMMETADLLAKGIALQFPDKF